MRYNLRLLLLLGLMVVSFSDISGSLEKKIITLGDVSAYRVSNPQSLIVSATPVIVTNFENQSDVVLISSNIYQDKSEFVYEYLLSSYRLGDHQIPTMQVLIGSTSYHVPAARITVRSAFKAGVTRNMITRFKPQSRIVFKWWNYLLLLFACLTIALGIILLINKFKQKDTADEPVSIIPRDPYTEAIKKLDRINDQGLLEKNVKQYYFEISSVVKEYLSFRFSEPLLESTTYEIKQILPSVLNKTLTEDFYRFFIALDPVKYAKQQPSINESKGKIDQAKHLLGITEEFINHREEDDNVI